MSVAEGIDLSDQAFWERSAAEREEAFAELRRDAPVSWQRPPDSVLVGRKYPRRGNGQSSATPTSGQSAGTRIPSSQFPVPSSQFPVPSSQFPVPSSQFPVPSS